MSTGRKSQLEKFNARMGKAKAIDNMIHENNAKEAMKTPEQKQMEANESMKNQVVSNVEKVTGQQFAPKMVAYNDEGLQTFTTLMMNSFESMLSRRDAQIVVQQPSVTIEDVEKLIDHKLGVMMNSMAQMFDKMYPQAATTNEVVEFDLTEGSSMDELFVKAQAKVIGFAPLSQRVKAERKGKAFVGTFDLTETTEAVTEPSTVVGERGKGISWNKISEEQILDIMFNLMDEAVTEYGIDINDGQAFKNIGGKFNTAYQRSLPLLFGKAARGKGKGTWHLLVEKYNARIFA